MVTYIDIFSLALTALSLVVAVLLVYWQRKVREISFGLLSSRRLFSVAHEISSRVRVQLDGKEVNDLHLLAFGLKNSGDLAIAPADFQNALTVFFKNGEIVSAEITLQVPSSLRASLITTDTSVQLKPLLLNAGDQIVFQVLVSSPSPLYEVDARIVDVPVLQPINVQPRLPPFFESAVPKIIGIYIGLGLAAYFIVDHRASSILLFFSAALFIVFSVIHRLIESLRSSSRRSIDSR